MRLSATVYFLLNKVFKELKIFQFPKVKRKKLYQRNEELQPWWGQRGDKKNQGLMYKALVQNLMLPWATKHTPPEGLICLHNGFHTAAKHYSILGSSKDKRCVMSSTTCLLCYPWISTQEFLFEMSFTHGRTASHQSHFLPPSSGFILSRLNFQITGLPANIILT